MVPRRALWIIGTLVAFALIVSAVLRGRWWVDALLPNLATELIGILVTVLIIDRVLQQRQVARDRQLAVIASRKLFHSLTHIGRLFAEMIHASIWPTERERPTSLVSVLTGRNAGFLVRLDLSALAHIVPQVPWVDWAAEVLASEKLRLRELIDTYLAVLPTDIVVAIEQLEDDTLVSFLPRFRRMFPRFSESKAEPFMLGDQWRGYVDDFFGKLRTAIEMTAKTCGEELPRLAEDWWEGAGRPEHGRHRGRLKDVVQIGIHPPRE